MKTAATIAAFCVFTVIGSSQSTLEEFQKMLESNPKSSMAHYGMANLYFEKRSFQAAANEFRSPGAACH